MSVDMKTLALSLYLAFSRVSEPLWRRHLQKRIHRGKEDPDRLNERFATDLPQRPSGALIWFHALGIGEALALIAPMKTLLAERPDLTVLFTTGTRTAADGLTRLGLPDGVIHQYAPVDAPGPVRRFLDHWRPDGFVVTELDMWPMMLTTMAARGIPMVMVNARLTDRRFGHRNRMRGLYAPLWPLFQAILVQDELSAARMAALGAPTDKVQTAGILKAAAAPLPDRPEARAELQSAIRQRAVWVAASTQTREHDAILRAHADMRKSLANLLLIIAPRAPADAPAIAQMAERLFGQPVPRRSLGQMPTADSAIYIADTMGEMGLVYRLAPIAFVGHSLDIAGDPPLSGKNPFEAAALGVFVLHGPRIGNFLESYDILSGHDACEQIADGNALAQRVPELLADGDQIAQRGAKGRAVLAKAAEALPITMQAITQVVPPAADL